MNSCFIKKLNFNWRSPVLESDRSFAERQSKNIKDHPLLEYRYSYKGYL
ncbi:hypothetical protein [Pleurocapsa sp. FMAR1]|nr:hypothetical protein [Pleurocapsa sp. FMAR1]